MTEWMVEALNRTIETIIGHSIQEVEESISRCLKMFSIFQDHSGSYEIEKSWLLPNIGQRPFQVLSGSEKTILLIGLKIALSKLMPGAEFFIMDNPLIHLDEHRRGYLIDYVTRLSAYKQVFILTNDGHFADQLSTANRINI